MFVAAVLAALAASPAPTASPLKEIIRVTGRPLCTALKDRIGPSIAALLQNDATAGDGTLQIYQMNRDAGRPWMQIDKLHLENDISRIIRNLEVVERLLRTTEGEAAANEGSDRDTIEALAAKLRAIADAQRSELNILDGTLETEQMGELMNSEVPAALATSGFAMEQLTGGEIASDRATYGTATPGPPALSGANAVPTPPSLQHATTMAPPSQLSHGTPIYAANRAGDRAASDLHSELSLEKAFTRSLLPVAAQCQRLASPPPNP